MASIRLRPPDKKGPMKEQLLLVLFCLSIGFIPPTLLGAMAGTISWWWPCLPIAGLVGSCLRVDNRHKAAPQELGSSQ